MDTIPYHEHVRLAESSLAPYAQQSLGQSETFLNGTPILKHFQDIWQTQAGRLKLANRTPLQLERDRILYSSALRKQTEKYHVLYSGPRRIIRNYTTHTMRMAHVTRAICKGLKLNSDFAEAIAIGSKVGAAPFIHVSKRIANEWLEGQLKEINRKQLAKSGEPPRKAKQTQAPLFPAQPKWLTDLESPDVAERAKRCIPFAIGDNVDLAYHSGAESYWLLCTQPYLRESARALYHPETMFGIWRHSRNLRSKADSFSHKSNFANNSVHTITWEHSTFEGAVVQFADDMTWIIENLNDANDAALLGGSKSNLFLQLNNSLEGAPPELTQPLMESDAGGLYTYFISDFVKRSQGILEKGGAEIRVGLRRGENQAQIGPSVDAEMYLDKMKEFLDDNVFEVSRIKNRNRMLESVTGVSLDLLFDDKDPLLRQLITDRANLENWPEQKRRKALEALSDEVHRAQLAVDVFVGLGDQEVFELVGIQAF